MRIIEPKYRKPLRQPRKSSKRPVILLGACLICAAIGYFLLKPDAPHGSGSSKAVTATAQSAVTDQNRKLKTFTGEQFKTLYNTFAYPNTAPINEHTPITGNVAADERIKTIAKERGYQMRSAPITDAFQEVGQGFQLQQRAAQPWLDLQAAARKDNIHLGLSAAYRSADEQTQIFLDRLAQTGIPVEGIATGAYDEQIVYVLKTAAIPGFSRHHTGYTIDIACEDQPASSFAYTVCFKWLSANNYEHAKNFGWIPSYPEETELQGPDPESWEYVWVGRATLTE